MRLSKGIGLLLVSAVLCASPAWAQPINDQVRIAARALADEGFALYDQGKYADALDKFERADALVNAPTVKLLAARTLEKLGRLVEAAEKYRSITILQLDDKAPEAFRDAQETAAKELAALTPRIPTIELTVQGAGAELATVMLDGKVFPRALIGVKTPLNPGVHRVEADTPASAAVLDLKVDEKQAARAVLELKPKSGAEPSGGDVVPPPGGGEGTTKKPPGATQRIIGYVSLGVGGAATIAGIGALISAYSTRSDMEDFCERRVNGSDPCTNKSETNDTPVSPRSYVNYRDSIDTKATLSTAMFVVGGVGLTAGVVLLLTAPKAKPASPTKASVEPWVGIGSVGLRGTF
ncbi:tetratricopeptide repeat protein [Polyangium jinanense]|uniref:Tetratricopeptide repeat protein n=1 Tax=Polyangium jinanense TaxID=2829994 RepID=A0A9X3XEM1_9BACT|nr:hypothetical protein [Polyangium jinanense]MDC3958437.1 hypothetical protein [Polyangium jinanense]MDC3987990.1 hypothetical protein [Polyangium jinanense]